MYTVCSFVKGYRSIWFGGIILYLTSDYFSIAIGVHRAAFGQGTGPIFLDYVSCIGNESSLLSCSHFGIGVAYCSHSSDLGVVCPPSK